MKKLSAIHWALLSIPAMMLFGSVANALIHSLRLYPVIELFDEHFALICVPVWFSGFDWSEEFIMGVRGQHYILAALLMAGWYFLCWVLGWCGKQKHGWRQVFLGCFTVDALIIIALGAASLSRAVPFSLFFWVPVIFHAIGFVLLGISIKQKQLSIKNCKKGAFPMPINIDAQLPARSVLEMENIFVMSQERAMRQDIRPLRIVILNLMPTKIETETQLLRLLSNTPIQVDVELLQTATHKPKHTPQEHLLQFYKTFDEIRDQRYDGMIVTGAPVENMAFEDVDYWPELCEIFEWTKKRVWSVFHICWGAQAGLYYHHGVPKVPLPRKLFGVYAHRLVDPIHPLVRGMDDAFWVPHSRYTEVRRQDVESVPALRLIACSREAGVHLVSDTDCRNIYATGHSEYDRETLAKEYFRDVRKGMDIQIPCNYFPDDDPKRTPAMRWRGVGSLLFSNWLNYFVYQQTPYDLTTL